MWFEHSTLAAWNMRWVERIYINPKHLSSWAVDRYPIRTNDRDDKMRNEFAAREKAQKHVEKKKYQISNDEDISFAFNFSFNNHHKNFLFPNFARQVFFFCLINSFLHSWKRHLSCSPPTRSRLISALPNARRRRRRNFHGIVRVLATRFCVREKERKWKTLI